MKYLVGDLTIDTGPQVVETVSQRIKLLRDALGDDPHAPRYIAGLRGRGYQLIAVVKELEGELAASAPATAESPAPRRAWAWAGACVPGRFARSFQG
jgi:DNA-binding winged helix-turn-helix (wHTH) protein